MVNAVTFFQSICCLLFGVTNGFNLDWIHPVILVDPGSDSSQFGRSLVLYTDIDTGEKWIRVGAPKGSFSQQGKTVQNSGLVYQCPFMEKCTLVPLQYNSTNIFSSTYKDRHNLADSLLGASMDVDYSSKTLVIGASNWHYFDTQKSPKIRGGIIVENIKNKSRETTAPFQGQDLINNNLPYFARAMGGFAVHITSNGENLLLGAPGVYNFIGTVMDIKGFQKPKDTWNYHVAEPEGRYNEYLGYSLTSGHFQNDGKTYYAVGIPRGQKNSPDKMRGVLLGSVAVFSFKYFEETKPLHFNTEIIRIIMGTQMGEYFGYSLAAGDLDRDGLDDLLVGAPYRQNDRDGFDHGSVYIFTKSNLVMESAIRVDGTSSGGLFGATIMFLGDLDKDGTCEVAISAPHENRSGVVYIYSYDKVARSMIMTQRIAASFIHSDLRGFGMSFSKPRDIDENSFDDIAIGAPISGHVVLLRSKPMVAINKRLEAPMFINTSLQEFPVKACFSYSDYTGPTLNIVRKLLLDEELRRFSLSNSSLETRTISMVIRREYCESLQVVKSKRSKMNFKDPIPITLTYELVKAANVSNQTEVFITKDGVIGNDSFCRFCPMLRRKSITTLTKQINWDYSCLGPNQVRRPCQAKMDIAVNFLNLSIADTFILSSNNSLYINVTVWNEGDTALSPQLKIILPDGITFRMGRVNCEDTDYNFTMCDLGEQLEKHVTTVFELNMKNINDIGEEGELTFFFNTSTITQTSGDMKGTTLRLKLKRVADFSIIGESKEFTYSIDQERTTKIRNILKIDKFGPSPVPIIKAFIEIPYRITGSKNNFTTSITTNGGSSNTQFMHCTRGCINTRSNLPAKRPQRLAFFDNSGYNTTASLSSGKTLFLNCSKTIDCECIECNLGPFSGAIKHAEISIEMDVDFTHIEDMLNFKESIQVLLNANLSMDFTQSGNKTDFTEIQNVIIIYKDYTLSLWILIGSVIAGFVILICLTIGLAKAGFFKRKEHEKLMALKELEEERLMDEMIKKEMTKDDIDEHSKFFGETIEEKDMQL
ncbi:integrin alpha-4-like isoform X2 [Rhynchophorus ferrugineus]|uniref:integrin alpha-4-like isoform X2 n=1 Tax=Rhynchophorus ferrugineus TaxID=354439 RepID=UPI003FCD3571